MTELYVLIDLERSIGSGVVHYWKPNRHGYTRNIAEAGRFDEPVAKRITDDDFDKRTVMVSETVVKGIIKDDFEDGMKDTFNRYDDTLRNLSKR